MAALIGVVVLLAIVPTCLPFSIDRLLLKGLEIEANDDVIEKGAGQNTDRHFQPQKWNDYKVPGFNGSYVKLQIDMIMSLEEAEKIYKNRKFRERRKRSAEHDESKLWRERRVPFHITDAYNAEQRLIIRDALQHWQQYTCLDFVPKLDTDHAYLTFENDNNERCSSFVGFQNRPQPIFLADKCVHRNVVIHEIGHAIGLFHEHTRPDRDEFVEINFNNVIISDDAKVNFDKGDWDTYRNYSKPYDYLSIMHYGKDFLSKNWKAGLLTIEPKNASYTDIIGKANTISFLDAQIINTMYQCSKDCKGKRCPPEGFLGRNCECYCPAPDEDIPMKLCEEQTFCTKPDVDQTTFLVFDEGFRIELQNLNKNYIEGAILSVVYLDDTKCGEGNGTFTCRKGQWVIELPECVPAPPCNIPEQWQSADGNIVEDGKLMHNTEISISCPMMKSADLAYCDKGTLYYFANDEVVNVKNPCCKQTFYRIINDEGRSCVVMYNSFVQYSITQGGERLLQGDHVGHLEEVEAACDIPDGNAVLNEEERMTIMTCIDGQWDNSPPAKCSKVRRSCSLVTNAAIHGPVVVGLVPDNALFDERYRVECLHGYKLNTSPESLFTCSFEGDWSPVIPACKPILTLPCTIPRNWKSEDGNKAEKGKVSNGTKLSVSCPTTRSIQLAICNNGTLYDSETNAVIALRRRGCGKIEYRIINNDARSCDAVYLNNVKYSIWKEGERLLQGAPVSHLQRVKARCDDADVNNEFAKQDLQSSMLCIDGRWDSAPPVRCPKVRKPCSVVTNAIVSLRVLNDGYDVECIPGHELNTEPRSLFTCTFDGKWMPKSPVCTPRSCIVPLGYRVQLFTDNNDNVIGGMGVKHADSVTLHCEWGEVASLTKVPCHLGEWQTPTKSLPVCNKVVCPTRANHPVNGINYQRKDEYVFGDTIDLDKCRGNLEMHGPKTLTCQKDGSWSGSTTCRKYCNGKSAFKTFSGKNMVAKARATTKFGNFSKRNCARKCLRETRFLCLAISYGYDPSRGYLCNLYDKKVEDKATSLKDQDYWEVAERKCSASGNS